MRRLVAYFDESGTHHGSPVVAVGGYVASENQWRSITKQWRAELRRAGVSAFHASDLEHRVGEFSGWSTARAIEFRRRLTDLLVGWNFTGRSGVTPALDFDRVVPPGSLARQYFGSPYLMSCVFCALSTIEWAESIGHRAPITFCFEQGAKDQGRLPRFLERIEPGGGAVGEVIFGAKGSHPGYEAADLHAYEAWKHAMNEFVGPTKRPTRKSLLAALEGPIMGKMFRIDDFPSGVARVEALLQDLTPEQLAALGLESDEAMR